MNSSSPLLLREVSLDHVDPSQVLGSLWSCELYGDFHLHPVWRAIIDTIVFQRLGQIHQMGTTALLIRSARTVRIMHVVGVAHLARTLLENLRTNQGLLVSRQLELVITMAGLLHDLGHGPFSHVYERAMEDTQYPLHHEHMTVTMIDHLLETNPAVVDLLREHDIGEEQIHLVKQLILGSREEAPPGFEWTDPSPDERWIYDVVANKRTGIDVDKLDYLRRDSLSTNNPVALDVMSLLSMCAVVRASDGSTQIAFHVGEEINLWEVYKMRYAMHAQVYQTPKNTGLDQLICDIIKVGGPHLTIHGSQGPVPMIEAHQHPDAYARLDDTFLTLIRNDPANPAKGLVERLYQRKTYHFLGSFLYPEGFEEISFLQELLEEARAELPDLEGHVTVGGVALPRIFGARIVIGYGMGSEHPSSKVLFFKPNETTSDPLHVWRGRSIQVGRRNPAISAQAFLTNKSGCQDVYYRLYTRGDIDLRTAFRTLVRRKGFVNVEDLL